jgi:hypothetical protein
MFLQHPSNLQGGYDPGRAVEGATVFYRIEVGANHDYRPGHFPFPSPDYGAGGIFAHGKACAGHFRLDVLACRPVLRRKGEAGDAGPGRSGELSQGFYVALETFYFGFHSLSSFIMW